MDLKKETKMWIEDIYGGLVNLEHISHIYVDEYFEVCAQEVGDDVSILILFEGKNAEEAKDFIEQLKWNLGRNVIKNWTLQR